VKKSKKKPILLLKKKHYKQELSASCVAAAARTLLDYHGVTDVSEVELRRILKTKPGGTNLMNLLFLKDEKRWKLDVEIHKSTLNDLMVSVHHKRILVIVFVDTGPFPHWSESVYHVVLVVGYDEDAVIVNDPFFDSAEIRIPKEKFLQAWDLRRNYMVIIKKKAA